MEIPETPQRLLTHGLHEGTSNPEGQLGGQVRALGDFGIDQDSSLNSKVVSTHRTGTHPEQPLPTRL